MQPRPTPLPQPLGKPPTGPVLGRKAELPVPRTTAAAAAAAAIGPYAVRGIAGKEGTGISGALWLHGKLLKGSLHFLLQNTRLTHMY